MRKTAKLKIDRLTVTAISPPHRSIRCLFVFLLLIAGLTGNGVLGQSSAFRTAPQKLINLKESMKFEQRGGSKGEFLARGRGHTLALRKDVAVLTVKKKPTANSLQRTASKESGGKARLALTTLPRGADQISATYSGAPASGTQNILGSAS